VLVGHHHEPRRAHRVTCADRNYEFYGVALIWSYRPTYGEVFNYHPTHRYLGGIRSNDP
jgi:hypothetical protein